MRKNWEKTWKTYWQKKRRRQIGGFLIRYNFVFTDRDTLNQIGKIAPEIMKQAAGQIEKIAQDRINQVIRSSGAEIERVLPKKFTRSYGRRSQDTIQTARKFQQTAISKDKGKNTLLKTKYVYFLFNKKINSLSLLFYRCSFCFLLKSSRN